MSSPLALIDLSGLWSCRLALAGADTTRHVTLPGSLDAQRVGDPVTVDAAWTGTIFDRAYYESPAYARYREAGNIKLPFWLQPDTRFVGVARYERVIDIPAEWAGRAVELVLERPHWRTRVWLDEREVGADDSLSTPHVHALGVVAPGTHRLAIEIDNRLAVEVGENAHSVSDHTQGNWNGVVGRVELRALAATRFTRLDVYPDVAARAITVRGAVAGAAAGTAVVFNNTSVIAKLEADGAFEARIALGADAPTWNEFSPAPHTLTATCGEAVETVTYGLREFVVAGTRFAINGRPVFLRGTLDCCIFPRTGHPPMDVAAWREILGRIKACGLNHVRFHSWCPPAAAFVAGDELGMYFQVEAATWPNSVAVLAFNSPAGIGDGAAVDAWAYREGERILRAYGNHPCFVMMACGNEPGGPHHRGYLSAWVRHFQALDPRRLYTGTAGWPELPENDFHVIPNPRIHQWGDGLGCRVNGLPPATTHDYREIVAARDRPVVSHEIGQWCAYPALSLDFKYTGHLKPRSHEIFAERLAANGLAALADEFTHASGRLQATCYKEEIESSLRTPGLAGIQLLGLQDFPGQGTAPVGLLDAFWEEKGYITSAEIRRFCAPTVPLARLAKRVFRADETFVAEIEVAHFGAAALTDAMVAWELTDAVGEAHLRGGELPAQTIEPGGLVALGKVSVGLAGLPSPARCRFVVRIATPTDDLVAENDWAVWLYPEATAVPVAAPANVTLARTLAEAEGALAEGRRVLLAVPGTTVAGGVALGFSPIFWNTACTQGQAPHTLGLLCDPAHPALRDFPTEAWSDWQWWYPIRRGGAFVLDGLPVGLAPVVRVIDDWFSARSLGLIVEARVGGGRLLLVGVDLIGADDPVCRQLLASLMRYAAGDTFAPRVELSAAQVRGLFQTSAGDSADAARDSGE